MHRIRVVVTALALSLAASCRSDDPHAVVSSVARASDGVEIAYDVRGAGEPTLVLVHCWGGSRPFWRNQIDDLACNHRVVEMDLAGHGASQHIRREKPTLDSLAGDVIAVMDAAHVERAVLIGHSMGGPISLMVAEAAPGRVEGIVAIDTLHDVDSPMPRDVIESFARGFEADFDGMLGTAVRGMVSDDSDPKVAEWIIEQAKSSDHASMIAIMRDFPNVDMKRLFASAHVPIRCINSQPRPPSTPVTAVAKNRHYADYDAVILDGVGHYPMLEKPAEFSGKLHETLAKLEAQLAKR